MAHDRAGQRGHYTVSPEYFRLYKIKPTKLHQVDHNKDIEDDKAHK